MSEGATEGDEDFRNQSKYKQFVSAVERALKVFELSTEWHDLISALAKLNKVLLAYMQYPVVPHHLTVCKRLTQCLHPNLPSGVHIKTLDVYRAIFNRIGPTGLSSDLLAYSSGLFPLITYSSMAVRSQVIEIYELYYVSLGENLRPALHGIVLGLLPGLEDESEHTERINRFLDTICENIDLTFFSSALWQCVAFSPDVRVPAANLILSKLDKKLTAEDQVHVLGGNLPLMVSAICAGLTDKNVLAVRVLLDILSLLFPLHRPFLLPSDITAIVVAALETLLKRDISLNRRLFSWLLGANVDNAALAQHLPNTASVDQTVNVPMEISYFNTYSANYVESALKRLCVQAVMAAKRSSAAKLDCIQPYRLLRALLERNEISEALMEVVMMDVVSCFKEQVESLGGITGQTQDVGLRKTPSEDQPKKLGRRAALKLDILQSANLFFNALNPEFLWQWLSRLLETGLMSNTDGTEVGGGSSSHSDVPEVEAVDAEPLEDIDSPVSQFPPSPSHVAKTFKLKDVGSSNEKQSDRKSCSYLINLTKFLLKSLPLDSMENAHLVHMPRLSLTILTSLRHTHSTLTADELLTTLDLISCIIHELMSSPSSHASTPATTPRSATPRKPPAKSPATTPVDAGNDFYIAEQLASEMTDSYLCFFDGFVRKSVFEGREKGSVFGAACQLLVLMARFGENQEHTVTNSQESIPWIDSLTSLCTLDWGSHDHHVTYVALETIFKLLQLYQSQQHSDGFPSDNQNGPSVMSVLITEPLMTHLSTNRAFLRDVTECLWSCLSHAHPSCHFEAAILLSWLHESLRMPSVCETVILEHFSSDGLEACHCFSVLWEHSPPAARSAKFLHRCILRMLEGLKSDSPLMRQFVQSWVTFALSRAGDLQALIQPLVKILASPNALRQPVLDRESEKYRMGMELSQDDAEKDQVYAKYYYDSLGIPDPMDFAKSGQHCEALCHYSQVIDTRQLLYALSLLRSTIEVDSPSIIGHMGKALVETTLYPLGGKVGTCSGEDLLKEEGVSRKTLLEVVITLCVDLMRSEYPSALEASLSHHFENLSVRMSSVELLCTMTSHLARLSADTQDVEAETNSSLSSSFVSALVTLCDVQKSALLVLGLVVKDLRGFMKKEENHIWLTLLKTEHTLHNPKFTLRSFFTQLFLLVYALVALDTQCHSKQSVSVATPTTNPSSSGLRTSTNEWLPPVLPSLSTASQPFFHSLILDVLSDSLLTHLHPSLLQLMTALLPNLLEHQLAELATKLLKQICSNLEKLSTITKGKQTNGRLTISYLDSLCSIMSWCLYGETGPAVDKGRPNQRTLNPYWRHIQVADTTDHCDRLSPTSRAPSTMSWLFSVFSTSSQMSKSVSGTEGEDGRPSGLSQSRVGLNSRAGQHMLMLLPAVYNAVAEVWKGCGQLIKRAESGVHTALKMDVAKNLEGQEVVYLVSQLVSSLAHREPVAFFSSVSHVWMEWNLGADSEASRRRNKRRNFFIDLLHHIQALSLGGVIDSVQTTLSEIGLADERVSGLLRQKYLLHFLYKYISSTLLSSEELTDCSEQLVGLLRELYNDSFSSSPDQLAKNCHILCMLTSILHVVICRVPAPDAKKEKKERRELQDLIHKLCEALSLVANTGIPKHKYHVTPQDSQLGSISSSTSTTPGTYSPVHVTERGKAATVVASSYSDSELIGRRDNAAQSSAVTKEMTSGQEENSALPTVQALAVLSNVLSHFVDCAFEGAEKDKVIALLKAVLGNIWPHLQSHSGNSDQSYLHAVKLLSSLSGFQVSRKAWRKEALELFLSPSFFQVGVACLREWRVVVDNLMTQDHVTFRDLLSRVHPSNTAGVVNIFISIEQEVATGVRLLKRVAFALLSAETDQFVEFLPDVQERLTEYLKVLRHPPICAVVMLVFRVILVRFSSSHLMAFWPAITSELLLLLGDLESDLCTEVSEGVPVSSDKLHLYLAVCKLLDTAVALPPDCLPHFQLLQWGFSNHDGPSCSEEFVVTKLCKHFKSLGSPTLEALHSHYTPHPTPPHLQTAAISSLRELKPLFSVLSQPLSSKGARHSPDIALGSLYSQTDEQQRRMKRIEATLLNDFVESN